MSDQAEIVVRADDDLEIIDGFLVNQDGEVVGVPEFDAIDEVVREEDAERLLEMKGRVQSELLAVRMRRGAILANLEAQERLIQRRIDYLSGRFDPLLEAYAARRLKHSVKRSFVLAHGRIGFRKCRGATKVVDLEKAIDFLRKIGREDLISKRVVESVSAPDLAEAVDRWEGSGDIAPSEIDFLQRTPERDQCTISTGILD